MELFDVYPRYDVSIVKGQDVWLWDQQGNKYLDMYCGHAVISIGHSHPHYLDKITSQLNNLGFYSNSVKIPIQEEYADKLGQLSGYPDHQLFLCNSGAEAIENALKVASFHTGRKKFIVFDKAFHGRTSLAIEATDDHKIRASVNDTGNFIRLEFNNLSQLEQYVDETVAGVLIEGIQGIAGIYEADPNFLLALRERCNQVGSVLILDEIQSGFGRTGKFFAHQYTDIKPDIITIAKGMGNGFPIGGCVISPNIQPWKGMLGTTFGGNPLGCAAALAVLEVLEGEKLMENAQHAGEYLIKAMKQNPGVKQIRGKGLMLGIELDHAVRDLRKTLVLQHHIFTGSANNPKTLRLLPPLTIQKEALDHFIDTFTKTLSHEAVHLS
jgi:acetylornithine aminotransferase